MAFFSTSKVVCRVLEIRLPTAVCSQFKNVHPVRGKNLFLLRQNANAFCMAVFLFHNLSPSPNFHLWIQKQVFFYLFQSLSVRSHPFVWLGSFCLRYRCPVGIVILIILYLYYLFLWWSRLAANFHFFCVFSKIPILCNCNAWHVKLDQIHWTRTDNPPCLLYLYCSIFDLSLIRKDR